MTVDITTWRCGSPPNTGQRQRYPGRFLFNVAAHYREMLDPDALHMFSGSLGFGTTTDLRGETGADIIAPFDAIPCPDNSFSAVLADPPYADHWQGEWHGDLPKPKHILREAARLVRPGGLIGILHIIVIPAYREFGVTRIGLHPILAGPNNAVRVFNVFRVNAATSREEPDPNRTGMPKCPCGDIAYRPDPIAGRQQAWRCGGCHRTLTKCDCATSREEPRCIECGEPWPCEATVKRRKDGIPHRIGTAARSREDGL